MSTVVPAQTRTVAVPDRTKPRPEGEGKPRRPEALDGLFDLMSNRYCRSDSLRSEMARRLNADGIHPVTRVMDMSERVGVTEHVAAITASPMVPAAKWGLQRLWHEDAILWSRIIGIMHMLPAEVVRRLQTSGYVVDGYVEDPSHLAWSRTSGLVLRWVMGRGTESTLRKLVAGLEMLQADPGVAVILGNDASGNAYVQVQCGAIPAVAS